MCFLNCETYQKSPLHGPQKFNKSMSSYVPNTIFLPGIAFGLASVSLDCIKERLVFSFRAVSICSSEMFRGNLSGGPPGNLRKNGRKHPKTRLGQAKTHLRKTKTHFSPFLGSNLNSSLLFPTNSHQTMRCEIGAYMNITHFKNRRIQLCPSPPGPYVGGIPWALDMC